MKIFTGTPYFSVILIALLWVIPFTSVQAKLNQSECDEKRNSVKDYANHLTRNDHYPESYIKFKYITEEAFIRLYSSESECPFSFEDIENFKRNFQITIKECVREGWGQTCGLSETDLYHAANAPAKDFRSQQTESNSDSPPPKKTTAAERKAQAAQQKAEDLSTKSQQLAQETQTKADAARQGKRKTNNQNYQASQCIQVDYGGLYGAMVNKCNYKIHYTYCGYHPAEDSWVGNIACENQSFGAGDISPLKSDAAHTKKVEGIYWLACKDPAWPVDHVFVEGQGVQGRCRER